MKMKKGQLYVIVPKDRPKGSDSYVYGFWGPFLNSIVDPKDVNKDETQAALVAGVTVKHFELFDHQFLRVTVRTKGQRDLVALVPREGVVAIIENEALRKEEIGFLVPKS